MTSLTFSPMPLLYVSFVRMTGVFLITPHLKWGALGPEMFGAGKKYHMVPVALAVGWCVVLILT
jgi:hypothetical protein